MNKHALYTLTLYVCEIIRKNFKAKKTKKKLWKLHKSFSYNTH